METTITFLLGKCLRSGCRSESWESTADGEYADICSSEWISRLRRVLVGPLERFGLDDIDASALEKTAPRMLTQLVSDRLLCRLLRHFLSFEIRP
jgi:hypothetical protein